MTVIEPVVKKTKADVYAIVTDKIIEALEAGTVPWQKPWESGFPLSMSTGKPYRGVNVWLLSIASQAGGFVSPYWGTYKKITELGGQVRKGEKSTLVTFWKISKSVRPDKVTGVLEDKTWAILRYYLVFNASQSDGLPEKYTKAPGGHDHDPIDAAQSILDGYVNVAGGPTFAHAVGDRAFYSPMQDRIVMPPLSSFPVAESYFSTAYHEATHSTGHKSRLARGGIVEGHSFADIEYGKEELVAEMGAAMLCGVAGIDQVVRDCSASYLQSWITTIQGDVKLVVAAAGQAQKAADLILGTTFDENDA